MFTLGNDGVVFRTGNNTIKKLRPLAPKVKLLSDFYVFDTETGVRTKDGIQWCLRARPENFIFGVIYGLNYCKVIHSLKELRETLLEPRFKNKYVFAHNLTYDLGVTYGNIFKLDPKAIFIGSRIIFATNGNCKFGDSLNIYNTSAENLGKMIGILKPQLGDDKMFSKSVGPKEINRCVTDCRIIWEVLFEIFEDAGDKKLTQASLSLTYFRRYHQKNVIEFNGNTKYFWNSYFGGRTEAFKIGPIDDGKVIDLNSAYPYAMDKVKFPNPKFLKVETNITPEKFIKNFLCACDKNSNHIFEGLAFCKVRHKKNVPSKQFSLGFLPYKKNGKLTFPTGTFSGCWNFLELRFAYESGVIEFIEINKIVFAEPIESPFSSYVKYLYNKRINSKDDIEIYRIKIFMNSLYGKFAQRVKHEQVYLYDHKKQWREIDDAQKKKIFIKLQLFSARRPDAFMILKNTKQINISYSIPVFSSYITSFVRILLLKKLIEMKDFEPVYCDTDSIFYEIECDIKDSSELGGWKKERKIIHSVSGLKNYDSSEWDKESNTWKRKDKIKGVPAKAKKIAQNLYEYEDLLKPKESLKRNLDSGVLTKRTKKISGKYDKREVLKNGNTKPINI